MEFRRDIATKMDEYIRRHKKSQAQAARELGISRQRLHRYLKRLMTPKSDFLCTVALKWNLEFTYRGRSFAAGAFKKPPGTKRVDLVQGELFKTPQIFRNDEVEIRIERKNPKGFNLSIEIRQVS